MRARPSDNPKLPTHSISVKVGDEFITIGACWTKNMKNGGKFLSCKLQDAWVNAQDNTKTRKGFGIVPEPGAEPGAEPVAEPVAEAVPGEDHTAIDPDTGVDLNDNSPF